MMNKLCFHHSSSQFSERDSCAQKQRDSIDMRNWEKKEKKKGNDGHREEARVRSLGKNSRNGEQILGLHFNCILSNGICTKKRVGGRGGRRKGLT